MKKYLRKNISLWGVLFMILHAVIFLPLPSSALPSVEELTSKIQHIYDQTTDLSAAFTQIATIQSTGATVKEEGSFFFKKPQRMLWDYKIPAQKKLVVNPEKAWLYIPEDNLAYLQDTAKLLTSQMTVRFLTGIGKLTEDFTVSFAQPGASDSAGNFVLVLQPKKYEAGIKELIITVNPDSYYITTFIFTDLYGNVTKLVLKDISINTNPPDGLFKFTPPPDVEVYDISE